MITRYTLQCKITTSGKQTKREKNQLRNIGDSSSLCSLMLQRNPVPRNTVFFSELIPNSQRQEKNEWNPEGILVYQQEMLITLETENIGTDYKLQHTENFTHHNEVEITRIQDITCSALVSTVKAFRVNNSFQRFQFNETILSTIKILSDYRGIKQSCAC